MSTPLLTHNHTQFLNGYHGSMESIDHAFRDASPPLPIPMPMPILGQIPHHQQTFFPPMVPIGTPIFSDHNMQDYCDYLYHVGFLQGQFSDIHIVFPTLQKSYALHSLVLSRSPAFFRRLSQPHGKSLEIDLDLSSEAIYTVLSHLYRPLSYGDVCFTVNENPRVALELLEATEELEMEGLSDMLMHSINQHLNQISVYHWIRLLRSFSGSQKRWIETLQHHLVQYLTHRLVNQLEAFPIGAKMTGGICIGQNEAFGYMPTKTPPLRGMVELARAYSLLPESYMKLCLEHEDLPVQDMIQRFHFAKQVLMFREQRGKQNITAVMRFDQNPCVLIVKKVGRKPGRWDLSQYDKV
ncbi:hypothetical protein CLU79DRAFT_763972 [Phycomyces nitens]|nr:hypothetical protein CLU79DRAFT_763972 [Phycomyces nitens]